MGNAISEAFGIGDHEGHNYRYWGRDWDSTLERHRIALATYHRIIQRNPDIAVPPMLGVPRLTIYHTMDVFEPPETYHNRFYDLHPASPATDPHHAYLRLMLADMGVAMTVQAEPDLVDRLRTFANLDHIEKAHRLVIMAGVATMGAHGPEQWEWGDHRLRIRPRTDQEVVYVGHTVAMAFDRDTKTVHLFDPAIDEAPAPDSGLVNVTAVILTEFARALLGFAGIDPAEWTIVDPTQTCPQKGPQVLSLEGVQRDMACSSYSALWLLCMSTPRGTRLPDGHECCEAMQALVVQDRRAKPKGSLAHNPGVYAQNRAWDLVYSVQQEMGVEDDMRMLVWRTMAALLPVLNTQNYLAARYLLNGIRGTPLGAYLRDGLGGDYRRTLDPWYWEGGRS